MIRPQITILHGFYIYMCIHTYLVIQIYISVNIPSTTSPSGEIKGRKWKMPSPKTPNLMVLASLS